MLQIIVGLGLLNVWLVRRRSFTPYRGGAAQTLQEELAAYGLPGFVFYLVGALKIDAAERVRAPWTDRSPARHRGVSETVRDHKIMSICVDVVLIWYSFVLIYYAKAEAGARGRGDVPRVCAGDAAGRDLLSGRQQGAAVVRMREAICLVGMERYGLRLKAVAEALGKSAESASRWVMHATARRCTDPDFAALLARLDETLAWPVVHPTTGQERQE